MNGNAPAVAIGQAAQGDCVADIQAALHSLARSLKRGALHDHLLARAQVDVDQAGLAILYVLQTTGNGLRLIDLAERLSIDAPAVTRKVQQLERCSLISRAADQVDARASRVQLTTAGRRTISRYIAARRNWLTSLVAEWSAEEKRDFACLLARFARDIHRQLEDLGD